MDVCNIRSVQRVVNFTSDNGKMLRAIHPQAIIPGVTMICDLPLLFMNGLPTCLENLSINQLEKLVPYMINCSVASPGTKPKWWPHETDFSATPMRPCEMSDGKWLSSLKKLVVSCYSYHGCDYALRLCANSSHECHSEWTLVDGLDGTMYLYNKVTRRLSTAFKSASIICSKRRRTFFNNYRAEHVNCTPKRRNKPPIQIYLCDICDSEFTTLEDMQFHEKICTRKCTLPIIHTQETFSETPQKQVSDKSQNSSLKTQSSSRVPQLLRSSLYLKKETEKETHSSAYSKIQEAPPYLSCGNGLDSSEKTRHHRTKRLKNVNVSNLSLKPNLHQFTLNSSSYNCGRELDTPNTSPQTGASLINSSPSRRKRMSLMPRKIHQEELSKKKSETNIYLCDKCDAEFSSFSDVQHHDTYCKDRTETTSSSVVSMSEADNTQECFLKYFHLTPSSLLKPCLESRGKPLFGNPIRYNSIPISSPLGYLIHGRTRVPTAAISSKIEKVERYCSAKPGEVFKPLGKKQNTDDWRVSWKSRQTTKDYSKHTYLYPTQRWWKMPFLRKMRNKEEEKLRLLRSCKSLQVSVRRMTNREVHNYTACRTLRVKLKKLTKQEINSYLNRPESSQVFENTDPKETMIHIPLNHHIYPRIQRLSIEEIKKYTKPTQILSDASHQITNAISKDCEENISPKAAVSKTTNLRKPRYILS